MAWVVFLRAVNVGGANRCQPARIAKQLAKFGVVNIGAVGTFVVREDVSESTLRAAIARQLPFKCEIMICPAKQIVDLMRRDPFSRQPSGPNITRFVNVLHKPLRKRIAFDLLQTSNVPTASSSHQSAVRQRLVAEDYCDPRQIRPGSISPADESD